VIDGLRPDSITAEDTPTLFRMRTEGVEFTNSHAVFPTVTRVNAAALSTGTQPGTNGIVGNEMYVPAVDPRRAFDTGDYRNLLRLDHATGGRVLLARTLAERLHARDLGLAAVSSGSTGSAFLLNPSAPSGIGVLINGYLDPGKTVAYPPDVNATVLARFGPAPVKKAADRYDAAVAWTHVAEALRYRPLDARTLDVRSVVDVDPAATPGTTKTAKSGPFATPAVAP